MRKIIGAALAVLMLTAIITGCGNSKKERILYSEAKLSKIVELGDYKDIPVDTSSDTFKEFYNEVISGDVESNDLYVRKTEGAVADGDTANIDYVGKKDGVAFEGGTADGYDLVIGSGSFIDGFESGLIGVNIGDTVDLNLTFPEDYGNEELNGAAVVFTVTVNYVKTTEERKPEDYFKELDFEALKDYENDVKERAVKNYLLDAVTANSKVTEYPEKDIETLYTASKNTIELNVQNQYGVDLATYLSYMGQTEDEFKESMITDQIKPMMDSQMVLYAILDEEKMEVKQAEVNAEIEKTVKELSSYNVTADDLKQVYGEYYFENVIVSEKVMDYIYDNAKIS